MNEQLGELDEDEMYLVLRHRRLKAYHSRPMTIITKALLACVALSGIAIVVICSTMISQVNDYKANGEQGEVPAPLSWLFKPKPKQLQATVDQCNPTNTSHVQGVERE
ncbi:hypothetical protein [Pseudomonas serbica]|uniref:hypothetical protein n=1 Tax=Pseudomonas serbica TaxID=2965074 RepID=UPI00237A5139|nr:hypothetical protein [Pseudomonas serbica]